MHSVANHLPCLPGLSDMRSSSFRLLAMFASRLGHAMARLKSSNLAKKVDLRGVQKAFI